LAGLDPDYVYEAACTVMMRLVFLLYAEERRLLPLGDELYDRSYAASTLRQELRDIADSIGNEETLEHSWTAWPRLLATFRAVYAGLAHDELRLPPYGGRLFDPDRFPFLEGRRKGENWREVASEPLPVDDRTVLAVLTALQVLEMRQGGVTEARRLSFRSLDVEQIGHVYEGLLDHGTRRIEKVGVGLVGKPGEEPEVDLDDLEAQAERGEEKLSAWFVERTGKSHRQVAAALSSEPDELQRRALLAACHNDGSLFDRVKRYANLLRDDVRRMPMVMHPGDIYVTEVSQRRDTGTEYTTKELADEVAHYALEPLVYFPGPAEGAAPEDWKLKPAKDILELRVCDPTVGSGAIITAACRYLADRLVEAWQGEGTGPKDLPTSAGDDIADVVIAARRAVAEGCLYGVDRDPMAVEMAKLSLWLVTMAKDRPFSFLDHAFQAGDSLLGITSFDQVSHFHIDPSIAQRPLNFAGDLEPLIKEALELRRRLEGIPVLAIRDAEEKARLLDQANSAMWTVEVMADLVVGAALSTVGTRNDMNHRLAAAAVNVGQALKLPAEDRGPALQLISDQASAWLNERRPPASALRTCLHWPLRFPEVFWDRPEPGFDAMVGNPPFQGGTMLTANIGVDARAYVGAFIVGKKTNRADLVSFFFRQAARISRSFGFLATSRIAEGDTREAGLDVLTQKGWCIYRAQRKCPWPGSASVEIAKVWAATIWHGAATLDDHQVRAITSDLNEVTGIIGTPFALLENAGLAFAGCKVDCLGFLLEEAVAREMLARDLKNALVVRPYLTCEDFNDDPEQRAQRWVIDFADRTANEAMEFSAPWEHVEREVEPIVTKKGGGYASWAAHWWQFWRVRANMRTAISSLPTVLVIGEISKAARPGFVAADQVLSHRLIVFATDDPWYLGVLNSCFHWIWASKWATSRETRICYSVTDVFATFPLPTKTDDVSRVAGTLDSFRSGLMRASREGLTGTYNLLDDEAVNEADVVELRRLHRELDAEVATAYGWSDLDLRPGFHDTPQGRRWTINPSTRAVVLDRLLDLNHKRHTAEHSGNNTPTRNRGRARSARTPPVPLGQGTVDWGTAGTNQ
jgi:hypothetical protein